MTPRCENSIKRLKINWQTKYQKRRQLSTDLGEDRKLWLTKKTRNSDSLTSEFHSGCKKELLESVQKKIGAPKSYTKEDSSWKDLKCSQISKTIQLALFKKEQAANQGKNISTMIRNYIGKLLLLLKHQASFLFR